MADRTVKVEILGDAKGLRGAFSEAGGAADGFGAKLGSMGKAVALAGVALAGGLAVALGSCIKQAMESEKVMAQTQAVIESTGGAAGLTATQVADMATNLSKVAPFDDEVIQQAENMLLTFTNIGHDVMPQATAAVLDMATALGEDTQTAAIQLGKALNDPVAGVTALQRVGVKLSETQKQQVADFMAVNDIAGAQGVILGELTKEFGGSAEAAGKTFGGQLKILHTQLGNVQEAIGMALIPVLMRLLPHITTLADWLGKKLPGAILTVTGFVQGLVDTFTKFADFLGDHDWAGAADMIRNGIVGGLSKLKDIGSDVAGWIFDAVTGVDYGAVGGALRDGVIAAWFQLTDWGGQFVSWVYDTLTGVDWSGVASTVATGIGDALGQVADFGAGLVTSIASSLENANWSGIGTSVLDGVVAGFNAVTDFGSRFVLWFWNAITDIDYMGTGAAVLNGIEAGWKATADFGGRFVSWFVGVFEGIEWGELGSTILNGIITGYETVKDFGSRFVSWFAGVFEGVEWEALGSAILDGIILGFNSVKGWGASFVSWFADALKDVEWGSIAQAIVDGLAAAWAKAKSVGQAVADAIKDHDYTPEGQKIKDDLNKGMTPSGGGGDNAVMTFLQPMFDMMQGEWSTIVGNFTGTFQNVWQILTDIGDILPDNMPLMTGLKGLGALLGGGLLLAVQGMLGPLKDFSGNLLLISDTARIVMDYLAGDWSARWDTLKDKLSTIWDKVTGIPGIVQTGIGNVLTALGEWVTNSVSIATSWVTGVVSAIGDFVISGPLKVGDAIAAMTLVMALAVKDFLERGKDIVSGIISGIGDKFPDLTTKAGEIVTTVVSGVGDLSTTLYNAGVDVIQGLTSGIVAEVEGGLKSAVSGIAGKIIGWKGPPAYDAVMLYPSGQLIMQGLMDGIDSLMPDLSAQMQGIGGELGPAIGLVNAFQGALGGSGGELGSNTGLASAYTEVLGGLGGELGSTTGLAAAFAGVLGQVGNELGNNLTLAQAFAGVLGGTVGAPGLGSGVVPPAGPVGAPGLGTGTDPAAGAPNPLGGLGVLGPVGTGYGTYNPASGTNSHFGIGGTQHLHGVYPGSDVSVPPKADVDKLTALYFAVVKLYGGYAQAAAGAYGDFIQYVVHYLEGNLKTNSIQKMIDTMQAIFDLLTSGAQALSASAPTTAPVGSASPGQGVGYNMGVSSQPAGIESPMTAQAGAVVSGGGGRWQIVQQFFLGEDKSPAAMAHAVLMAGMALAQQMDLQGGPI